MSEENKARMRRIAKLQAGGKAKEFERELSAIVDTSIKNISWKIKEILRERFPERAGS